MFPWNQPTAVLSLAWYSGPKTSQVWPKRSSQPPSNLTSAKA
jgi:hypothetical protein